MPIFATTLPQITGTTVPSFIPTFKADLISSYGALTGVEGESVLVGCFDYNGKEAYYVVNNDREYSTTVTLNFDTTHSYKTYNADATAEGSGSIYSNTLTAGAAVLIVLD